MWEPEVTNAESRITIKSQIVTSINMVNEQDKTVRMGKTRPDGLDIFALQFTE